MRMECFLFKFKRALKIRNEGLVMGFRKIAFP